MIIIAGRPAMASRNYPEWDDLPDGQQEHLSGLGIGPSEYNSGEPLTSFGLSVPIVGHDVDTGISGQWRITGVSGEDATILGEQSARIGDYVLSGRTPTTNDEGHVVEAIDAETGERRRISIATDEELIEYLARIGELDDEFYRST